MTSHSSYGWRIQEWLWYVILAQDLSHEATVRCQPNLQSSESLTRERGSTSTVVHSTGWQVDAGCWQEASALLLMGFLKYPHGIAGFSQRKYQRPKWKLKCFFWPSFRSYIFLFMSYSIGHTVTALSQCGRVYMRLWLSGGKDDLGPSWSLIITWD